MPPFSLRARWMVYAARMNDNAPVAQAAMLIRCPAGDVFQAFVDPAITSKFWFSDGSDVLREAGQHARWRWQWYGIESRVEVMDIARPLLLRVRWGESAEAGIVTWRFSSRGDGTFVEIEHAGFQGDAASVLAQVRDSTEGFALVLAGAKAWLELGVQLNLVPDRHPDMRKDHD